ncbi:hypothetical protein [Streptomyces sp. NPDC001889]
MTEPATPPARPGGEPPPGRRIRTALRALVRRTVPAARRKPAAEGEHTAPAAPQPPSGWREVLHRRPWAQAALRLERGTLPALGEAVRLALPDSGSAKDKAEHLVIALFVIATVVTAVPQAPEVGMPFLTGLYLWRAWALGSPDTQQPGLRGQEEQPESGPLPAAPELDPDRWLAAFVEYSVAVTHREGRKGIHLSDLLAGAQKFSGRLAGWDVARLRKECERLAIPVSKGINIGGKNTIGIRYDELHQHLGRRPQIPPGMVPDHTPSTTPAAGPSPAPKNSRPDGP